MRADQATKLADEIIDTFHGPARRVWIRYLEEIDDQDMAWQTYRRLTHDHQYDRLSIHTFLDTYRKMVARNRAPDNGPPCATCDGSRFVTGPETEHHREDGSVHRVSSSVEACPLCGAATGAEDTLNRVRSFNAHRIER